MSATRLAELVREKKVSSQEVVEACLARIAAVNPRINAVVQLCAERALREAKEADALLARGQLRGALHGVPMTIKDSFDTAGVVSTGGTLGRKDHIPGRDATVVARLRAAGAILLGKTNTPEFTLGGSATDNLIYGLTRNPYNLDYHSGASSGGGAAIVAAGGAPFDIGSDFSGSIRAPCNACGIAGLKPTHGRVPRTGHIIDYGGAYDAFQQVGPMARRVEDLGLILRIVAGPDYADAAVVPMPLADVSAVAVGKLRVAYYATDGHVEPRAEMQEVVRSSARMMADVGARVTEARPPRMKEAQEIRTRLAAADGYAHMSRLVKKAGTTQTFPMLRLGGNVMETSEFTRLLEELDASRSAMLEFLEGYDVILCPASAYSAQPVERARRPPPYDSYRSIYNITGWPAAVVRAGTSSEGLPLGIQVVGRPWAEDVVLAVAAHVESVTGGWRRPPL